MITEKIKRSITGAIETEGISVGDFAVEHPSDLKNGDYSTNVALAAAKQTRQNPRELAAKITANLNKNLPEEFSKIEVAGAGFINFYLSPKFFVDSAKEILTQGDNFGRNDSLAGKKIMVEYTDPNPFKVFHIGHLMSNSIGESIARLSEIGGAKVVRACWQGDVGLHVAKAMWGILNDQKNFPADGVSLNDKVAFLGNAYVAGAKAYEENAEAKKEIEILNKKIFEKSDSEINKIYEKGRSWSLDHFEEIYEKLGTKFNRYFFEGKEGVLGIPIVEEFLQKGVFEKSEGAVVYKGEKVGLHTRVFITSQGLPTYETKELGLNKAKFESEPDLAESVIITANEQSEYFKVVLAAMKEIFPEIAAKTKHISHGMMRFASGKMSSRTGNVITGESLIFAMENLVFEKMKERDLPPDEKQKIATEVAIGAIKYSVLKQAIGGDIIYDFDKSISFEGDSGPYLQYSFARASSVLRKAESDKPGLSEIVQTKSAQQVDGNLERMLYRFPEVVSRSLEEFEPHHVATYLTELAGAFNNFYAHNKILDAGADTPWRLVLTEAFSVVMRNGLKLLGIDAPEKM